MHKFRIIIKFKHGEYRGEKWKKIVDKLYCGFYYEGWLPKNILITRLQYYEQQNLQELLRQQQWE